MKLIIAIAAIALTSPEVKPVSAGVTVEPAGIMCPQGYPTPDGSGVAYYESYCVRKS